MAAADRSGSSGLLAAMGRCPPLLGMRWRNSLSQRCERRNDMVRALLEKRKIDTVILAWRTGRCTLKAPNTAKRTGSSGSITTINLVGAIRGREPPRVRAFAAENARRSSRQGTSGRHCGSDSRSRIPGAHGARIPPHPWGIRRDRRRASRNSKPVMRKCATPICGFGKLGKSGVSAQSVLQRPTLRSRA